MKLKLLNILTIFFLLNSPLLAEEYVVQWQWNEGKVCRIIFPETLESDIGVSWDGNGEPPISVSGVRKLVSNWIESEYGNGTDYSIVTYELTSYRGSKFQTNHWLYNIRFVMFSQEDNEHSSSFENVVVLMDGKILAKECK